jgi:hypothetical protein
LSRIWSRAVREMQMPPGSANASSRAAMLTPRRQTFPDRGIRDFAGTLITYALSKHDFRHFVLLEPDVTDLAAERCADHGEIDIT